MFKRNGDKNVCLMCYAFIILTLNWDKKYEEYDLLLPESIVEYVIYHLKRIKRKNMNQNIEWIQFLWTYVIKHSNVKLRFPLADPTKWYKLFSSFDILLYIIIESNKLEKILSILGTPHNWAS